MHSIMLIAMMQSMHDFLITSSLVSDVTKLISLKRESPAKSAWADGAAEAFKKSGATSPRTVEVSGVPEKDYLI